MEEDTGMLDEKGEISGTDMREGWQIGGSGAALSLMRDDFARSKLLNKVGRGKPFEFEFKNELINSLFEKQFTQTNERLNKQDKEISTLKTLLFVVIATTII